MRVVGNELIDLLFDNGVATGIDFENFIVVELRACVRRISGEAGKGNQPVKFRRRACDALQIVQMFACFFHQLLVEQFLAFQGAVLR